MDAKHAVEVELYYDIDNSMKIISALLIEGLYNNYSMINLNELVMRLIDTILSPKRKVLYKFLFCFPKKKNEQIISSNSHIYT